MSERVFLDTCVLYPEGLRSFLLALAERDLFEPVWSARVVAEWALVLTRRRAVSASALPIVLRKMAERWPQGEAKPAAAPLVPLPDWADSHVLGAAQAGKASLILTLNLRDFPPHRLATLGLRAEHPDRFALGLWQRAPEAVVEAARATWPEASPLTLARALRREGLWRLGKALGRLA